MTNTITKLFKLTVFAYLPFMLIPIGTLRSQQQDGQRLSSGDWGVTIDAQDSTRAAAHLEQDSRSRAVTAAIWGRRVVPFGETSQADLSVQGSYNWSRSDIYLDLDLLRARLLFADILSPSTSIELSAGRFRFQDPSGLVLNHRGDGLSLRVATLRTRTRLSTAYTGLQLNPTSGIRMTRADRLEEIDTDETFGPRRIVLMSEFSAPELLGNQSPSLTLLGQLDARDAGSNDDTVHSGYAVAGLSGRLFGNLYSDIFGSFTAGIYDDTNDEEFYTGYMASARLRLFLPRLRSSRISLRGVYTSASDDVDDFDGFRPISRTISGTVLSVPIENLIIGELGYSIRPFSESDSRQARNIQVATFGRVFFTASDNPPTSEPFGAQLDGSVFAVQAEPDGNYVGSEAVLRINARVRSDLGLGLTTGMFFPGTGSNGVFTDERKPEFLGRLELSTRL